MASAFCKLNARPFLGCDICSHTPVIRSLLWYERLLLNWLARSPRIDQLLIVQMPGGSAAERQQQLAAIRLQQAAAHLEELYQGPAANG